MKRKKHRESQILEKLRLAERLATEGLGSAAIARRLENSEQTYYRWRKQYEGADKKSVQRLRELECENENLKRLVADKELDIMMLKGVLSKKW